MLFQMKEYELCIRDITRAFDNSYPNNIVSVLIVSLLLPSKWRLNITNKKTDRMTDREK